MTDDLNLLYMPVDLVDAEPRGYWVPEEKLKQAEAERDAARIENEQLRAALRDLVQQSASIVSATIHWGNTGSPASAAKCDEWEHCKHRARALLSESAS